MTTRRRERIAHNEARFRSINEELQEGLHRIAREREELAGFVCECGDRECAALVHVPLETYEDVRSNPRRFLIRPGHEMLEAEDVVQRSVRFAVVEKHEDLRQILEESDPRS